MRKIKIGVYDNNCGHQITKEILANPDIPGEIVACCQCPEAEGIENVVVYDSLEEMLADEKVELISLCSPNRRRQAQEAIMCMRAGKHVLAEKPCAMTEEELDELIRVSEETGMHFHEMAGTVFAQPFWAMRKLVMSGQLGEIVQVYSQKSYPLRIEKRPQNEDIDGGLLLQVGVHNLRFIEHITGLKIKRIRAVQTKVGNPDREGNLHTGASYMMVLENGGVASAVANYMNFPKGFGKYGNECVRVFGTEGYAEIMDGGRKSRVIIGDEDRGGLDTSEKPKSFLTCYLENLLGNGGMPFDLGTELHPARMVIRARNQVE